MTRSPGLNRCTAEPAGACRGGGGKRASMAGACSWQLPGMPARLHATAWHGAGRHGPGAARAHRRLRLPLRAGRTCCGHAAHELVAHDSARIQPLLPAVVRVLPGSGREAGVGCVSWKRHVVCIAALQEAALGAASLHAGRWHRMPRLAMPCPSASPGRCRTGRRARCERWRRRAAPAAAPGLAQMRRHTCLRAGVRPAAR